MMAPLESGQTGGDLPDASDTEGLVAMLESGQQGSGYQHCNRFGRPAAIALAIIVGCSALSVGVAVVKNLVEADGIVSKADFVYDGQLYSTRSDCAIGYTCTGYQYCMVSDPNDAMQVGKAFVAGAAAGVAG